LFYCNIYFLLDLVQINVNAQVCNRKKTQMRGIVYDVRNKG